MNKETLLDVTTRAYLDDKPLKAVEKQVSEHKVDIEALFVVWKGITEFEKIENRITSK